MKRSVTRLRSLDLILLEMDPYDMFHRGLK